MLTDIFLKYILAGLFIEEVKKRWFFGLLFFFTHAVRITKPTCRESNQVYGLS